MNVVYTGVLIRVLNTMERVEMCSVGVCFCGEVEGGAVVVMVGKRWMGEGERERGGEIANIPCGVISI